MTSYDATFIFLFIYLTWTLGRDLMIQRMLYIRKKGSIGLYVRDPWPVVEPRQNQWKTARSPDQQITRSCLTHNKDSVSDSLLAAVILYV